MTVGGNLAKGIHLRDADPVAKEHLVVVEPVFMNEKEIGNYCDFFAEKRNAIFEFLF